MEDQIKSFENKPIDNSQHDEVERSIAWRDVTRQERMAVIILSELFLGL